jgi:hypothetical protein
MNMKVHRRKTITALAAAASLVLAAGLALAIGAAPSQAAPLGASTKVSACLSASELSQLPLTDRHLTEREKCNLAVVLRAYHDGEGTSLDPQGFRDLFAKDGVLNGIGGVEGQTSLRGPQLSGLITFLAQFMPNIHRQLELITVSGNVVAIELEIQGTFLGPFQTPAGAIKPTGAKIDFPTADFWYLRNGKVETFDCHIAFTTLFAQLGILPNYAAAVGKGS